jgi:hypothetical protein
MNEVTYRIAPLLAVTYRRYFFIPELVPVRVTNISQYQLVSISVGSGTLLQYVYNRTELEVEHGNHGLEATDYGWLLTVNFANLNFLSN